MIKTSTAAGHKSSVDFKAERPFFSRPKIEETFFEGKVKMYRSGARVFIADLFDAFFKPSVLLKVKGGRWKGSNPDRTHNWLNDEYAY
jgi:hypothetical protein